MKCRSLGRFIISTKLRGVSGWHSFLEWIFLIFYREIEISRVTLIERNLFISKLRCPNTRILPVFYRSNILNPEIEQRKNEKIELYNFVPIFASIATSVILKNFRV